MIDAGEHEVVGKLLNGLRRPCLAVSSRWNGLWNCSRATSRFLPLPDALAHLGDALVAEHEWERAKKTFEQLLDANPESGFGKAEAQWRAPQNGTPGARTAEELPVENLRQRFRAPAPKLLSRRKIRSRNSSQAAVTSSEPALDDENAKILRSRSSGPLRQLRPLRRKPLGCSSHPAPRTAPHADTRKTAPLCLGAGDDRRTADLPRSWSKSTVKRAIRQLERFGELRRASSAPAG